MPPQKHHTTTEESSQAIGSQDDWTKEVVPHLPAQVEEQAKKLKALERERSISSATDLLRGLLAYVYTAHSFQQLSMWSLLIGLADVSANDWRKRLRKASDWLLQEVLAMAVVVSPWLVRTGLRRILLIDGTHWKCLGPQGIVMRVHTAFDLLAGRLTQIKVTDCHEGEHLEIFDLQKGERARDRSSQWTAQTHCLCPLQVGRHCRSHQSFQVSEWSMSKERHFGS